MAELIDINIKTLFVKPNKNQIGEVKSLLSDNNWVADFVFDISEDIKKEYLLMFCIEKDCVFIILKNNSNNKQVRFYFKKQNRLLDFDKDCSLKQFTQEENIDIILLSSVIYNIYNIL